MAERMTVAPGTLPSRENEQRLRVRVIAVLIVLAALIAGPAASAGAAGTNGWSIEPSSPDGPGKRAFFAYDLGPGQSLRDTVAVTNATDQTLRLKLYARDSLPTSEGGAVAYQQEVDDPVGAGSWITLPVDEYTLGPGTRADIAFTLTIPENAPAGDHVAGIIAAVVGRDGSSQPEAALQIEQRIAARVYVRVQGDATPALDVTRVGLVVRHGLLESPARGTVSVQYTVRNTGEVRLSPDVTVSLRDVFGRTMATSPVARLPEMIPGSEVSGSYAFSDVAATGRLSAEVRASTLGINPTSASGSSSAWAVPWSVLAPLVVVAAGALWWRRRRRDRQGAPNPELLNPT